MTAAPAPSTTAPAHPVHEDRHPVHVALDGDFALADLLALPPSAPAQRISASEAAQAALWRITTDSPGAGRRPGTAAVPGIQLGADVELLHRIETAPLFRPPVHTGVADLTPDIGARWLALAAHWIDLSTSCGDLRFLNAACKLTGAVWLHHTSNAGDWHRPHLTGQLAAVGQLLGDATDRLRTHLAHRVVLPSTPETVDELRIAPLAAPARARIIVLAGGTSRSAGRLVAAAVEAGLPIDAVYRYTPADTAPAQTSNYSSAWYPPAAPDSTPTTSIPTGVPVTAAASWDEVTAAIRDASADLVLLVSMPVVPARVLDAVPLGVLNAHNGALPTHRGMDAVGWALLHNDPIVCSLHLARPAVDTGEVIAAQPVPVSPTDTLAARVKTTQLQLLLAGAAHVAATGALPHATPQSRAGTQFYRLHPHLKRELDASPYAHNHHAPTVMHP